MMLVDFLDTFRAIVTFGNHLHFNLRTLYGISFPYHRAECPVTAEVGVSRHQQVTEINRFIYVSVQRVYRIQETVHLLDSVGNQYSLEVIAVFQSAANTGGDGIHVFEYRTIFDTRYVVTNRGLDKTASQPAREDACFVFVGAGDGQIREAFQGYFFRVAGERACLLVHC